ncbi:MAG: hypothetical protein K6E47_14295 [Lachnospiraceae bacterium]|nr:hypothetical protein [Lachnospiraceae bacterium]
MEKTLKKVDHLITKRRYEEALEILEKIAPDSLDSQEKAFMYMLEGIVYMNTASLNAIRSLYRSEELYRNLVEHGNSSVKLPLYRCVLSLAILNYVYGRFEEAERLVSEVLENLQSYEPGADDEERLLILRVRLESLIYRSKILDRKGLNRVANATIIEITALSEQLEDYEYEEKKLDAFVVKRVIYSHHVHSGFKEIDLINALEEELHKSACELLGMDFQLYSLEAARFYMEASKAYYMVDCFSDATASASNAMTILEELCWSGHKYAEGILARAYNLYFEACFKTDDGYESAMLYLHKGQELAEKCYEDNEELYTPLMAYTMKNFAEFLYFSPPEGERSLEAVRYGVPALKLYYKMYVSRGRLVYWNCVSSTFILLSFIYSNIDKEIVDQALSTARIMMKKYLKPSGVTSEEENESDGNP